MQEILMEEMQSPICRFDATAIPTHFSIVNK